MRSLAHLCGLGSLTQFYQSHSHCSPGAPGILHRSTCPFEIRCRASGGLGSKNKPRFTYAPSPFSCSARASTMLTRLTKSFPPQRPSFFPFALSWILLRNASKDTANASGEYRSARASAPQCNRFNRRLSFAILRRQAASSWWSPASNTSPLFSCSTISGSAPDRATTTGMPKDRASMHT